MPVRVGGGGVGGEAGQQAGQVEVGGPGDQRQVEGGGGVRAEGGGGGAAQGLGEGGGEPGVGLPVEVGAGGRVAVQQQQDGAGRDQGGGGRSGGVAECLQLAPDPFQQREFGEFALGAEPLLDLVEAEGGAGLGAAGGFREVRVAAAPVGDRGPADAGQPGDLGGRDLGAVRHLRSPSRRRAWPRSIATPLLRIVHR
ncbi:hypothetical protein [Kitasatospora sp. NA04385]|uniref:hypothetical protein n=1 Tax=Kitasatospora sp. NA04385 TaxID=2742135 RepID=UPI0020CB4846|nr:hypothetical protein [Kitasatospora sp. NA04385]